jgi:hypothetical protein
MSILASTIGNADRSDSMKRRRGGVEVDGRK